METIPEHMTAILQRIADIEARMRSVTVPRAPQPPVVAERDFAQVLGRELATPSAGTAQTPEAIAPLIEKAAASYGIRPGLLRAVAQVESGLNPSAVSPKGALGLMQLMPGTAAGLGAGQPFDAEQNVMAGAGYLQQQLDRFGGDERLALAAYNAGPGAVARFGGVPPYPETQRYVDRVLSLAQEDDR